MWLEYRDSLQRTLATTFENINPFMSPYSNATVDAAHREYKTLVKQSFQEIDRLQKSSKMYEGSVKKLEDLMPQVIHMEVRNGKPAMSTYGVPCSPPWAAWR